MSKPKKHTARIKRWTEQIQAEIHRMFGEEHIKTPDEFSSVSDLSLAADDLLQAIETKQYMNGK